MNTEIMHRIDIPVKNLHQLNKQIRQWGAELGFQQIGITDTSLDKEEEYLANWLQKKYHGKMNYMEKHGTKRSRPEELVPGTTRVISLRMNYMPEICADSNDILDNQELAFISRYALGRDYHKVIRSRLKKLASKIKKEVETFGYRIFVDSAPVLEKAFAAKSGLGWVGKHTNLINKVHGSWFFLGELYTNLPLPLDAKAEKNLCGKCKACMDVCPTKAIVAPYQLDARKCISYLTIELKGSIPEKYRTAIGNRIFGCDDCQLVCPWNKYAKKTTLSDFLVRDKLDRATLVKLFSWDTEMFFRKTEGSAIRRVGYEGWLRNIAVALGNAPSAENVIEALQNKINHKSKLVHEHVLWALEKHNAKS